MYYMEVLGRVKYILLNINNIIYIHTVVALLLHTKSCFAIKANVFTMHLICMFISMHDGTKYDIHFKLGIKYD